MPRENYLVFEGTRPPHPSDGKASFGTPVPSPWGEERVVLLTPGRGKQIMDDHSRQAGEQLLRWFGPEGVKQLHSKIPHRAQE